MYTWLFIYIISYEFNAEEILTLYRKNGIDKTANIGSISKKLFNVIHGTLDASVDATHIMLPNYEEQEYLLDLIRSKASPVIEGFDINARIIGVSDFNKNASM